MTTATEIVSSIKTGDYTDATKGLQNLLAQKTLDAINAQREVVGQQMLGQTNVDDVPEEEFFDDEETLETEEQTE